MNEQSAMRPAAGRIGIRVFHAHALIVALERELDRVGRDLKPKERQEARERVAKQIRDAAITAMIARRCGPELSYLPFRGAGRDLVLSSSWSAVRAILTIEIDARPAGAPRRTLVGALPPARARR